MTAAVMALIWARLSVSLIACRGAVLHINVDGSSRPLHFTTGDDLDRLARDFVRAAPNLTGAGCMSKQCVATTLVDAMRERLSNEARVEVFDVIRTDYACRTAYYDRILAALEEYPLRRRIGDPDPILSFVDVDTAMVSWPDTNAALMDAASWVEGSKDKCYPWPQGGMFFDDGGPMSQVARSQAAARVLDRLPLDQGEIVVFNMAGPSCRRLEPGFETTDIHCEHIPLRHPMLTQVVTAAHNDVFDREKDISWPLPVAPHFVSATERLLGGPDGREQRVFELENDRSQCEAEYAARRIAVSFVGTASHEVRWQVASALADLDDALIIVRAPGSPRDDLHIKEHMKKVNCNSASQSERHIAAALTDCSRFVVAPRGHMLHSSRLLEAIAGGAVPIVVSDGWVLPFDHDGLVDWDKIALRASDARNLSSVIEAVSRERWCAMAAAGQRAWLDHLADVDVALHTLLHALSRRRKMRRSRQMIDSPSEDGGLLSLPSDVAAVLLNIGSSLQPVLPAEEPGVIALAFEPLLDVAARIPRHPRLRVVPAAVSSFNGIRTMTMYNNDGISSSLGRAASTSFWNVNKSRGDGDQVVVPVLSLRTILDSLAHIQIPYLKTDMQGADFAAVQAAVDSIRKIPYMLTEVWLQNEQSYHGFDNDLCRHWLPLMDRAGYRLVYLSLIESDALRDRLPSEIRDWSGKWAADPHLQCAHDLQNPDNEFRRPGLFEADAYWMRNDTYDALLSGRPHPPPPVASQHDWPLVY